MDINDFLAEVQASEETYLKGIQLYGSYTYDIHRKNVKVLFDRRTEEKLQDILGANSLGGRKSNTIMCLSGKVFSFGFLEKTTGNKVPLFTIDEDGLKSSHHLYSKSFKRIRARVFKAFRSYLRKNGYIDLELQAGVYKNMQLQLKNFYKINGSKGERVIQSLSDINDSEIPCTITEVLPKYIDENKTCTSPVKPQKINKWNFFIWIKLITIKEYAELIK